MTVRCADTSTILQQTKSTMQRNTRFLLPALLSFAAILAAATPASAAPITYIFEGTTSGSLDGVDFEDESFTITALADTDNIDASDGPIVVHDAVTIELLGMVLDVFTRTTTWVNTGGGLVGFGNDEREFDLLIGPFDPIFETWDLASPVGPITGRGFISEGGDRIATSGGQLDVVDDFDTQITFTAVTAAEVPEPGTLILIGGALLLSVRRFRRRKACRG